MTLLDANLLLYAFIDTFEQHKASRRWLEEQLAERVEVGLGWQVITAFIRIGTNARLFTVPMSLKQVEDALNKLLLQSNVKIVVPTDRHWRIFLRLLQETNATANLVMDVHLAALTIEHNAELATTDGDFARFKGLSYFNPLDTIQS